MRLGSQYLLKVAAEGDQAVPFLPQPVQPGAASYQSWLSPGGYAGVDQQGVGNLMQAAVPVGQMVGGETGGAVAGLTAQYAPLLFGKTDFWQKNIAPHWQELTKLRQMGPGTGDPGRVQARMNAQRYAGGYVTPAIGKAIIDSPVAKVLDGLIAEYGDKVGIPKGFRIANADPSTIGQIVKQFSPIMPELTGMIKQFVPQMLIDDSGLQRAALLLNRGGHSKQVIDRIYGDFYKAQGEGRFPPNAAPEMISHAMARAVEVYGPNATVDHAINLSRAAQAAMGSGLINANDPNAMGKALRMASSGNLAKRVMIDPSAAMNEFGAIRQMAEGTGLSTDILQSVAESASRVGMSPLVLGKLIAKNSALLQRYADNPEKAEKIIGDSIQHYAALGRGGQSGGLLAYAASKNKKLVQNVIARGPDAVAKFVRDLSKNPAARRASRYLSTEDMDPALVTDTAMEGLQLANEMHKAKVYRNKDATKLLTLARSSPEKFKEFVDNKSYAGNTRMAKLLGSRGMSPSTLGNMSTLGINRDSEDFKPRFTDVPGLQDQAPGVSFNQPQQPLQPLTPTQSQQIPKFKV
jgi:hypothetical protein